MFLSFKQFSFKSGLVNSTRINLIGRFEFNMIPDQGQFRFGVWITMNVVMNRKEKFRIKISLESPLFHCGAGKYIAVNCTLFRSTPVFQL